MNKQFLYSALKIIPKPLRAVGRRIYSPTIPVVEKIVYGEDSYPEATELMCKKLKDVVDKGIEGDVIEFGTFKGGSILKLGKALDDLNSKKKLYGLDTFDGLPEETEEDSVPHFYKGTMKSNLNKVKNMLDKNNLNNIILMKGLFSESIPKILDKKFCFAFIDCDLYQGAKEALEFLIPRMNKGGVIFIDDYYSKSFIGIKKAVLEFLPEKELIKDLRVYWIKN